MSGTASRVLGALLMTLLVLVALVIALYGAWVATSLAVFHDGPVWLAVVGAVTCFFLVPLGWEVVADRQQKGGRVRDAILRSAFLSLTFLVVLLLTHPATAFKALATRGDWFLGGSSSATAESIRGVLHTLGDGLEGIYDLARSKIVVADEADADDADDADQEGHAGQKEDAAVAVTPAPNPSAVERPGLTPRPAPGIAIPGSPWRWPLPATQHPSIAALPESVKKSIGTLGRHLGATIADPFERAKAVHDFVATWIRYDVEAFRETKARPSQSAEAVFRNRLGVCDGYARLFLSLAKAAGLKVRRVVGDTRSMTDYEGLASADADPVLPDGGHAWNAIELAGRWYLVDTTWDAGYVDGDTFVAEYETTYFLVPPEVIRLSHLPDEDRWQLVDAPLSRSDWLRLPLVKPAFVSEGLALASPQRPAVSVSSRVELVVDNPRGLALALHLAAADGGEMPFCARSSDTTARLSCDIPKAGRYSTHIGVERDPSTNTYSTLGSVLVDASP